MRKHRSSNDGSWVSLADSAYAAVRDGIIAGVYPLGSTLSRRKLAAELHTSILPVSEALQRLESEGLVENKPRVGTIIRVPSPQEVRGRCIVREALECQSARLYTEKAGTKKRDELMQLATELDRAWSESSISQEAVLKFRKRHMALHMKIAEAGGCEALAQAIERNQVLVFTNVYDTFLGAESQPPAEWHASLVHTLNGTDIEASEAAMRAHVKYGLERLLERLEPFLGWDESKLSALIERQSRRKSNASQ